MAVDVSEDYFARLARSIAAELKIPVMTAVDAYTTCMEIAPLENTKAAGKPNRKKSAA